jgi:glutamate-1-semialdehyde 2,1-aminomutase
VPKSTVENTASLGYNDLPALRSLFQQRGSDIAAVIVEPVVGNMGCVPPKPGFLEGLVELCDEHGALSIIDEVMTGSRLSRGGAQQRFKLKPDLTCLGKVVGGGMPLAVYGGRRDVMSQVAPLGPVYQGGTLSGNPLAVSAGLATLEQLDDAIYDKLEGLGQSLEAGLNGAIAASGQVACVQRVGSMLTVFFQKGPVTNYVESSRSDKQRFASWHASLLKSGIYWPPSGYEAAFISASHTPADIERTVSAAAEAFKAL